LALLLIVRFISKIFNPLQAIKTERLLQRKTFILCKKFCRVVASTQKGEDEKQRPTKKQINKWKRVQSLEKGVQSPLKKK